MACDRWEQSGLLYASGELSTEDSRQFGRHLESCAECRAEHETYVRERARLYGVEVLGEATSPVLDRTILEACGNARKPVVGFRIFALLAAKPVMAGLFLMLGLSAGTYVAYNVDNAHRLARQTQTPTPATPAIQTPDQTPQPPALARSEVKPAVRDSLDADSAADSTPFPASRSKIASGGVVTVDLIK